MLCLYLFVYRTLPLFSFFINFDYFSIKFSHSLRSLPDRFICLVLRAVKLCYEPIKLRLPAFYLFIYSKFPFFSFLIKHIYSIFKLSYPHRSLPDRFICLLLSASKLCSKPFKFRLLTLYLFVYSEFSFLSFLVKLSYLSIKFSHSHRSLPDRFICLLLSTIKLHFKFLKFCQPAFYLFIYSTLSLFCFPVKHHYLVLKCTYFLESLPDRFICLLLSASKLCSKPFKFRLLTLYLFVYSEFSFLSFLVKLSYLSIKFSHSHRSLPDRFICLLLSTIKLHFKFLKFCQPAFYLFIYSTLSLFCFLYRGFPLLTTLFYLLFSPCKLFSKTTKFLPSRINISFFGLTKFF